MNSSTLMNPYHQLVKDVLDYGEDQLNRRTGSVCRIVVGTQMKFDLRGGFPLDTRRPINFTAVVGELLGFFRGYTSAAQFRALNCNYWNDNANKTKAWLDNLQRLGEDDLGRIYGANWTNWHACVPLSDHSKMNHNHRSAAYAKLHEDGWHIVTDEVNYKSSPQEELFRQYAIKAINQLEDVVTRIMTDPTDRGILLTGWNPGIDDFQALRACHLTYKFIPMVCSRTMHLVMDMRSMDLYLGTPSNIASAALLLAIVCRLTGYTPATLTIQGANTHLYEDSFYAARQLLTRESLPAPTLYLGPDIRRLADLSEVRGCFERIEPGSVVVLNYKHAGPMGHKVKMAA